MIICYLGFSRSIPISRFWLHFFVVSLPLAIKDAWFHFCILHPKKTIPSLISRHILGWAQRLLSPIVSIRWFVTGKHVGRVVRRYPVCGLRQKATIPRSASAMANPFSGAVDKSKEFYHLTRMFYSPTSWCIWSCFPLCWRSCSYRDWTHGLSDKEAFLRHLCNTMLSAVGCRCGI